MTNKAIAIGIGNIKQHGGFQDLDEALILMDKATKKAIKDSSENITNFIDEIRIPILVMYVVGLFLNLLLSAIHLPGSVYSQNPFGILISSMRQLKKFKMVKLEHL